MEKSIDSLKKEFATIRTGKANPAILNDVMVSYYGVPTPVSQVGSVSASDPQTIVVKPWDKSILKDIEKAILTAGLGLNPQNDGEVVRIHIPPLNEQTRKDLAKQAKKVAEDNKVAIRNVRRDANDSLKKLGLPEDDEKGSLEDIQKLETEFYNEFKKQIKERKDKECWINEKEKIISFTPVADYVYHHFDSHEELMTFILETLNRGSYRVQ